MVIEAFIRKRNIHNFILKKLGENAIIQGKDAEIIEAMWELRKQQRKYAKELIRENKLKRRNANALN